MLRGLILRGELSLASSHAISRSLAYIACERAEALSLEGVRAIVHARFPAFAPQFAASADDGDDLRYSVIFANRAFTVIVVPAALPHTEWTEGVRANLAWSEAGDAMTRHRAHIIVAPIGPVEEPKAALRQAVLTTILTAAIAEAQDALAILWVPAGTVVEPRSFRDMARDLVGQAQLQALPLDSWLRLAFGRAGAAYVARTAGLRAFTGFELQVSDVSPDPAQQGAVLYGVAAHAIRGATLAGGDTVEAGQGNFVVDHGEDGALLTLARIEGVR